MTAKRETMPATFYRLTSGLARGMGVWSVRATDIPQVWWARYRDRRKLETLSEHMLKDMGISRVDADHEAGKRFWRC